MGADSWVVIGVFVVGGIFSVIGYLLSRKDVSQETQILELYKKHEDDVYRLQILELKIAETHYRKPEVDRLIDGLKGYLNEKFSAIEQILKEKT
jgi:hypothetical protein